METETQQNQKIKQKLTKLKMKFQEDSLGISQKLQKSKIKENFTDINNQFLENSNINDINKTNNLKSNNNSITQENQQKNFSTNKNINRKISVFHKTESKKLKKRKRHHSLEDLSQLEKQSSSQEEDDDEDDDDDEDEEQNKKIMEDVEGFYFSDKDAISFKNDNYMKISKNVSDFEDDLLREIHDEERIQKDNNEVIEEENDEGNTDTDEDINENENDNYLILPTLEEKNYRKQNNLIPKKTKSGESSSSQKKNIKDNNNNDNNSKTGDEQEEEEDDQDEDEDEVGDFQNNKELLQKKLKITAQQLQKSQERRKKEIEKRKIEKLEKKQKKKEKELNEKLQKNKNKKKKPFNWSTYKRLLTYTHQEWKLVIKAGFSMLCLAISQIFVPRMCGDLLDATIQDKNLDLLNYYAIQALFLFTIHGIAETARTYYYHLLGEKIILALRSDCFSKFIKSDIEFHDKQKSGDLICRITTDITTAKAAASGNIGNLFRHITISLGYVAVLLYTSWKLSIVILICVPIFITSSNYYGNFTKKMVKKYQKVLSKTTQLAQECFLNIRTVKAFSNEESEILRFDKKQKKGMVIGQEKSISLAMHNGMESILSNGAKLCVLWYGGYLVIQSEYLTSGQLASFILYTNSLASSASSITSCMQKIYAATGACERLFELMDYEPKIKCNGGKNLENFKGKIEFKNVDFQYPSTQDVKTLDNFNLVIDQGDQIAFVGSSGSGKSTIIRLIERFYDVTSGEILIDGTNIKEFSINSFRKNIGYVSQEPILFSGTIESNLVYGVGQEYTDEELDIACKQAQAYDFIQDKVQFPKGYKTQVGEQGVKLSGGQKQRIAIARALLKRPKILIFDEATSALDAESEFQVQEAIDNLMKETNLTIIMIAHRLSTIVGCEKIVVLNQGKVLQQGSHYELLQSCEFYKNLIERQINAITNT